MKFQTNSALGEYINRWGCHICSILEKVEILSARIGKPLKFANSDVCAIYQEAMRRGAVQQEVDVAGKPFDGCSILDGAELFNLACELFSVPLKAVGYRKEGASYVTTPDEEEILELNRGGYNGSHFVSGNGKTGVMLKDEIEFDPIEGGSKCAAVGWIKSKRILTWRKK